MWNKNFICEIFICEDSISYVKFMFRIPRFHTWNFEPVHFTCELGIPYVNRFPFHIWDEATDQRLEKKPSLMWWDMNMGTSKSYVDNPLWLARTSSDKSGVYSVKYRLFGSVHGVLRFVLLPSKWIFVWEKSWSYSRNLLA